MDQYTQGTSPKLKAAVLVGTVATALVTLAAVLFPHVVTSEVAAAVTGAIVTISTAVGVYWGSPGNVVGFTAPEDAVESPPFDLHAQVDPADAPDQPQQ